MGSASHCFRIAARERLSNPFQQLRRVSKKNVNQVAQELGVSLHAFEQQASPVGQASPHEPQFAASVARFTQAVGLAAGHAVGSESGHLHALPEQISFVSVHACPHAPQFARSVTRFTHAVGLAGGHSVENDIGHWQLPRTHSAFVSGHAFPQLPQLDASVSRLRQRGFSASQRVRPSHWQTPPAQVPDPHATQHPPQWEASVLKSAQIPRPQSAWPGGHPFFAGQPARMAAARARKPASRSACAMAPMLREERARRTPGMSGGPAAGRR